MCIVAVFFFFLFLAPFPCAVFSFSFLCAPIQLFGVLRRPSPSVQCLYAKKMGWIQKKSGLLEFFLSPFAYSGPQDTGSQFNLLAPFVPLPSSLSLPSCLSRHKEERDGNTYQTILYHFTGYLLFLAVISLYLAVTSFLFIFTSWTGALPCHHFCLLPWSCRCLVGLRYRQACYL